MNLMRLVLYRAGIALIEVADWLDNDQWIAQQRNGQIVKITRHGVSTLGRDN